MRKASIAAATVAAATAGSAIFGGAALAGGWGHHHGYYHGGNDYGGDGKGGKSTNNCLNVGIPILSGIGIAGQGKSSGASCSSSANGTGGDAY